LCVGLAATGSQKIHDLLNLDYLSHVKQSLFLGGSGSAGRQSLSHQNTDCRTLTPIFSRRHLVDFRTLVFWQSQSN
jgi:hypothetical protein